MASAMLRPTQLRVFYLTEYPCFYSRCAVLRHAIIALAHLSWDIKNHLLGMLRASLENLISRPWISMPTLKAVRKSSPLGLLLLCNMSLIARRAGSTAPEGWVAGCQVSSKSIEWACGKPTCQSRSRVTALGWWFMFLHIGIHVWLSCHCLQTSSLA